MVEVEQEFGHGAYRLNRGKDWVNGASGQRFHGLSSELQLGQGGGNGTAKLEADLGVLAMGHPFHFRSCCFWRWTSLGLRGSSIGGNRHQAAVATVGLAAVSFGVKAASTKGNFVGSSVRDRANL